MVEVAVDVPPHHLAALPRSSPHQPSRSPVGRGSIVRWVSSEADGAQPRTNDRLNQRLEQAGAEVGVFIGRWALRLLNVPTRRQDASENRPTVPVSGPDGPDADSHDRVSMARRQANAELPQPAVQGMGPAVIRGDRWTLGKGPARLSHETLLSPPRSQRAPGDLVVLAAARPPMSPRREPHATTERCSSLRDIGVRTMRWLADLKRSEGWASVLPIIELAEQVPFFQAGLRRLLGPSGAALLPLGTTLIGLILSAKDPRPGAIDAWPLGTLLVRYALGGFITPPVLDLLLALIGVAVLRWATGHQPLRFALLPCRIQSLSH